MPPRKNRKSSSSAEAGIPPANGDYVCLERQTLNVATRWRLRSALTPHEQLRTNFWFAPDQGLRGTVAADISLAVIHKRAKRPGTARRSELVNNCAAGENFAGERPAPAR
ncbi:MAG TPA: hypothetical protein VN957_08700, partial [Chthoniobacterales bacterium]|nr:hypothetical protein [Chthoniobacterales bacterium]